MSALPFVLSRMDNAEMAAEELEAFPDIEDVEEYLAIRNRIVRAVPRP